VEYVVCLSGGHSSALVAIEAVRKVGKENVILLNHDISPLVEDLDIKRFKKEISKYLEVPITYANMEGWETKTPLKICKDIGAFKVGTGTALCTYNLKTKPFYKWLNKHYPVKKDDMREDVKILYGFDKSEPSRIQRRIGVMQTKGYYTDFPLAYWNRTIQNTEDIGIKRPKTYELFRHANCIGCLKAGKQQWYLVYCLYPEIWKEAIETENAIGYSILKDTFLEDLEPKFKQMKCRGIVPGEKMQPQTFWAAVEKALPMNGQLSFLPCECAL
jgi:hypothetical protein